mmetsp:Transcript_80448/g.120888  ORF Transcript_80448/g.120888 Transcript_80448/m.120888 type:complete len:560 (+) Transcript_80448:806-2485(+)
MIGCLKRLGTSLHLLVESVDLALQVTQLVLVLALVAVALRRRLVELVDLHFQIRLHLVIFGFRLRELRLELAHLGGPLLDPVGLLLDVGLLLLDLLLLLLKGFGELGGLVLFRLELVAEVGDLLLVLLVLLLLVRELRLQLVDDFLGRLEVLLEGGDLLSGLVEILLELDDGFRSLLDLAFQLCDFAVGIDHFLSEFGLLGFGVDKRFLCVLEGAAQPGERRLGGVDLVHELLLLGAVLDVRGRGVERPRKGGGLLGGAGEGVVGLRGGRGEHLLTLRLRFAALCVRKLAGTCPHFTLVQDLLALLESVPEVGDVEVQVVLGNSARRLLLLQAEPQRRHVALRVLEELLVLVQVALDLDGVVLRRLGHHLGFVGRVLERVHLLCQLVGVAAGRLQLLVEQRNGLLVLLGVLLGRVGSLGAGGSQVLLELLHLVVGGRELALGNTVLGLEHLGLVGPLGDSGIGILDVVLRLLDVLLELGHLVLLSLDLVEELRLCLVKRRLGRLQLRGCRGQLALEALGIGVNLLVLIAGLQQVTAVNLLVGLALRKTLLALRGRLAVD